MNQPPAPSAEAVVLSRTRSRRDRLRAPVLTGAVVAGLTIALHFRDPHGSGSWGYCPWLELTGLYCPGCGGLRAVNDLTNGDVRAAAGSNLVFVASIPLLVFFYLRWARRAWTGDQPPVRSTHAQTMVWIGLFVALMLVFTVLRNLPGSWLAP